MTAFWATTVIGFIVLYKPAPKPVPKRTFRELCHEADVFGCVLLGASIGLLLLGFTWAGPKFPWVSAGALAPITIGGVGIILFCLYEWKARSDGIINHEYFRIGRNFGLGAFAVSDILAAVKSFAENLLCSVM